MLDEAPFSDSAAAVLAALQDYLPPERMSVADHAAQHRYLDNRGGGYIGRWSHDEAPYLIEPMVALSDRRYLTVAVVGPARSGKTSIGQNWLLQSVDVDPADMLVYMQTEDTLESYVKREINPLIDLHPALRDRLGSKPIDRSLHFKRFRSMWVEFLAATYSNMISKSAPRLVLTELDAYQESLGDAYALASLRRETFGHESMVLAESHPDAVTGADPKAWNAGIMKLYRDSTRCTWWWPCPHCNAFSSPHPIASRQTTLDFPVDAPLDEIEQAARLRCPCCGAEIEDRWRRSMNKDGVWVGEGQDIDQDGIVTGERSANNVAGYWITGLMSPFVIGGIGALARYLAKAVRDYEQTGDDADLRAVTVKRFGLPYQPPRRIGALDATALADRSEPGLQLGVVPKGVRFLTTAIDVQANRFEFLVRGWGEKGESWVVDVGRVSADPASSPADWDDLIGKLRDACYPLSDDSGRSMRTLAIGFDSGGQDGVTLQAYDAWRRARRSGKARMLGKFDGRDGWTLLPLKGGTSVAAQSLAVTYPDTQRKDRLAAARGQVPVGQFNPNRFKDDLATQLSRAEPGPWAIHFPAKLRSDQPPHTWFEQLVAERRKLNGGWEKIAANARNEALDLMVMTHVVAHLFGLSRLRWESPPSWAAPWDRNPLVSGNAPVMAEQEPPPSLPPGAEEPAPPVVPSRGLSIQDEEAPVTAPKRTDQDRQAALRRMVSMLP